MPQVRADFFAANDVNGAVLHTMTDEAEPFERAVISPRLRALGGGTLVLSRDIGPEVTREVLGSEAFVRFVVPSIHATKYVWGMFINFRNQTLVSADERGGERFVLSGLGPKFYLDRAVLWAQKFGASGTGFRIDPDNQVATFADNVTVGDAMTQLMDEDASNPHATFLPDLTLGFDDINDSNGSPWTSNYQLGEDFELEILRASYLSHLWAIQEACKDDNPVEFIMDLGEIGSPLLQLDARKNYGRDSTGTEFGAGVVLLREGVNIEGELRREGFGFRPFSRQSSGIATRKASHVITIGADNYGSAVLGGYSPGDYAKAVGIDAGNYSKEEVLDRKANRWIHHQQNADNEFELSIVPGFDEEAGHYFAGPSGTDGHVWPGDTVTLKTGETVSSAFEYEFAPQRVTGIDLVLRDAARSDTDEQAARSWDLSLLLNVERGSDNPTRNEAGGGSGSHRHPPNPKLCPIAIECFDLTASNLTDADDDNGDAEDTGGGQWTGGAYTTSHKHAGARGYGFASTTDGTIVYTFDPSQVFEAGTRYVLDVWKKGSGVHVANTLRFGVADVDDESSTDAGNLGTETGADGDTWALHRICWTPTADRTGVRFSYREQQSSGTFHLDDLALYTTSNDELAGTSKRAARCDHRHHAQDIVLRPPPGWEATNVQAGFDEWAARADAGGSAGLHSHPIALDSALEIAAAPDGGWNRNLQPRAIRFQGWRYWTGLRGTNGDAILSAWEIGTDPSTIATQVIHAAADQDDHVAGVLAVRESDHKLIHWHTGHGASYVHQSISMTSLDTDPDVSDGFAAETNLDAQFGGTAYTHPAVAQFSNGDLMFMVRDVGGSDIDWKYGLSTDGAATWPTLTSFYNNSDNAVHVTAVQTAPDRVDFLATTDNPLSGPSGLVHFYYDALTDTFHETDDSAIASLPASAATATEVWDGSVAPAFNYDVKLGADGNPVVGFVVFEDIDTDHRAYWGRWSGAEWTTFEIAAQGGPIGDASDPAQGGGLVLDWREPTIAYVSREIEGTFEMFRYTTPDGGPSWVAEQWTVDSAGDNFRPYAVMSYDNAALDDDGVAVLWPFGSYTNLDVFNLGMWSAGITVTTVGEPIADAHIADPTDAHDASSISETMDGDAQTAFDNLRAAVAAGSGSGGFGPLLITSEPAGSPLIFADLLQNSEGNDLLYASEP